MRFELSNDDIGKCLTFSIEVTKKFTKDYYKKRNKYASTEKLIFDHCIGKMAEIATWSHLSDAGKECTYPNFKVRSTGDNGDLKVITEDETIIVHCKCVRFDSPVTDSWLIEEYEVDKHTSLDYLALCKFYDPNVIEVMKIVPALNIKWQKPRNPALTSKLACYLDDLLIDTLN